MDKNNKRLFKIHNEKSNERKITEFFQDNDSPLNKIGNKKTIKKSEQPTIKKNNNNNQHICRERNIPYNSTYYWVSKYLNKLKIQTPRKKYTNLARPAARAVLNQKEKKTISTRSEN